MLRSKLLTSVCVLASFLAPAPFAVADDAGLPDDVRREDTVYVYGTAETYAADGTRSASKTDTPLVDLPLAVTVLTRDLLDDQAVTNISEALRNVPGVTVQQGEGHRDAPVLRGNVTTADFFVDGVRDDLQYLRDTYNTERLEVLKGSAGLTFGRGTGGGAINRVTKTADGQSVRALSLAAGSFGFGRATGDFGGALSDTFDLRLNGLYESSDSFRDSVSVERTALAPAARIDLAPTTRLDVMAEYYQDLRTTDRGVPSFAGKPWDGSEKAFFGNPDLSESDVSVTSLTSIFSHEFSDALSLRGALILGDHDKIYTNVFANSAVRANGTVDVSAYVSSTARQNMIGQADLIWKGTLAGMAHTVLIGTELGQQESENLRVEGQFPAAANAERLVVSLATRGASAQANFGRTSANNANTLDLAAIYIQDQIALTDQLDLVAGVRFDRFDLAFDNNIGADLSRTDEFTSPRLGLVYSPIAPLNLYAGWSQSHLPQSGEQFSNLTTTLATLEPQMFENLEVGVKWQPLSDVLVTAALYRLDRDNVIAPGAVAGMSVLTGSQRSEGLELSLQGELVDGWDISAAYALQSAEITSTTSAAPAGRQVAQVPEHSATLWNKVALNERVALGLGFLWRGESFASVSNAVTLPAWARADAAVYYTLSDRLEVQLNFENITGETYWSSAHNDNNISPGAPFTGKLTLAAKF